MSYGPDHRVDDARKMSIEAVATDLGIMGDLKRAGRREYTGPCPACGGTDRFGMNTAKDVFLCRHCTPDGGDVIRLVMLVKGCDFPAALEILCGAGQVELSPGERRRRDERRVKDRKAREARAEQERRNAIAAARVIWRAGREATGSPVQGYLAGRGIGPELLPVPPPNIRFHPALKYMVKAGSEWAEVHRGPAMLAAMHQLDGRFSAVHRTWLDPSRPGCKIEIERDGKRLDAKKGLGSKKGAAIRLFTPEGADTMVVGEGIETTLTAYVSGVFPDAAFWVGVDLGNMAGQMRRVPGKRWSGIPDMADARAFVPPAWVRRLVFIQDGDSDPRMTRAKLESGLQRAMAVRPGIWAQIWPAPKGADLNDLVMGAPA